jgi:hypothetical protein
VLNFFARLFMATLQRPGKVWWLVVLAAASMIYYHLGIFVPRAIEVRTAQGFGGGYSFGADFYPIWLTCAGERRYDPYNQQTTQQIQIGLFGRTITGGGSAASPNYRAFSYPAFTDLLLWPLALLPFSVARILLVVILAVATALSIVLWLRALRIYVSLEMLACLMFFTLSSYAVLEGLFAEQMGLLVGFLLASSLAGLMAERLFLSGSLLALALIKPQVMALVGVYLLLWSFQHFGSRWRFCAGFFFMMALLNGSSVLVWPRWIGEWLRVVFGYREYSTPPLVCYLMGTQLCERIGFFLIAALLIAAVTLAWRMRSASATSPEFGLTISLLFGVTAITILPGHAVYDHVVLLPGIILIAKRWRDFAYSRLFRMVLGATALTLFWQWICAPLVIAMRPIFSPELFNSIVLTLPIRTAASIPFGVTALLVLMLRKVPLDRRAGLR